MPTKMHKNRKSPPKIDEREEFTRFEQLPNIGPKIADHIRRLGMSVPQDLRGRDAYKMYKKLCLIDKTRYDPCVLDVFISAVKFMDGGPAKPWWKFTAERKRMFLTSFKSKSR
jgi:hypothetical protein